VNPTLFEARLDLEPFAIPTPQWRTYARAHALDPRRIADFAGPLAVAPCIFWRDRFDLADPDDPDAVLSAVIEARVIEDGEPVAVDLVAWPLDRPDAFATLSGAAEGLGIDAADNPATFFAGKALRIHRTPLGWLRAGCNGAVILKPRTAARWLAASTGAIAGDDDAHARLIARLLHPHVHVSRIGFMREAA
jgi:hypothetical protein